MVREEYHGLGPVPFYGISGGSVGFGGPQSRLLPPGIALSRWLHRHFRRHQSIRVSAIRSDRAAIEFRGFPPATRDELRAALGSELTVQESDWNCGNRITPNHQQQQQQRGFRAVHLITQSVAAASEASTRLV